jgi:transposase-like protein
VYLRLRAWVAGHPNVAVYDDRTELRCNRCGSEDMHKRGFTYTQVGQYQRYQCAGCGGWSKSRYTLNSIEKRKSLVLG